MRLLHRMRIALNTYESVKAYRTASATLSAEAFSKWSGQNARLLKFMEYIWTLQGVFDE